MQPDRHDKAYLWDMLDSCKKIFAAVQGKAAEEAFQDEFFFFALEKLIEIIGEAANRVSKPFQNAHPEIPWSDIIGMRNRLIHEYADVDIFKVWDTVSTDIPPLIQQLNKILPEEV